jgi:CheY-like chemotaxis protein
MDFRMPVMDGTRRSAASGPGRRRGPKIIAVTASAMDDNRQELMEVGADDFIGKPFREAELFQKIHAHVGVEYLYAEPPRRGPGERPSSRRRPWRLAAGPRRPDAGAVARGPGPAAGPIRRRRPATPEARGCAGCRGFQYQALSTCSARGRRENRKRAPAGRPPHPGVDDTPANLQVLAGMLKDRGYRVRPVPGGSWRLRRRGATRRT